jgi:hypothetical protein
MAMVCFQYHSVGARNLTAEAPAERIDLWTVQEEAVGI